MNKSLSVILVLAWLLLLQSLAPALAQSAIPSVNFSVSVTTGNTYQQVLPTDQSRRSLTVQNNNTNSDNCWINDDGIVPAGSTISSNVTLVNGATVTTAKASILLPSGGLGYTRYYPYVPSGPIVVTCASSGDSVYVATQ